MMNPIEEVFEDDIFTCIVEAMNEAENFSTVGSRKKQLVLQSLKTLLGREVYERYEPMLGVVIDGLVSLNKKDVELVINKTKKCYRRCC